MPSLSVVVTVVEGGATLERCLEALASQSPSVPLDVIVPYDESIASVTGLGARFPFARFVAMGRIAAEGPRDAFAEHGLYERRRAAGLRAATAPLVAMIEDRGWPRPNWGAAMIALHEQHRAAAIGGVVAHGGRGALRWALFFSDFGRYQSGMPLGTTEYLSDVNICYKREPLEQVRELWQDVYQESAVNWALRRAGHELLLAPDAEVVETRAEAHLLPVVRERMHWARIFAHVRGRETPLRLRRLAWAAVTPLLPSVLFARHVRRQFTLRRYRWELVKASPALLLVLHCWAFGELVGYCEAAFGSAAE